MGANQPAGEAGHDRDPEFDDYMARIARAAEGVAQNIDGMRKEWNADERDWQVLGMRTLNVSEALLSLVGLSVAFVPVLFKQYPKTMTFCSTVFGKIFGIIRNCVLWIADLMKVIPGNLLEAIKTASSAIVNLVETLATVTTAAFHAASSAVQAAAGWLVTGVNSLFQICTTTIVTAVMALGAFIAANPVLCVCGVVVLIGGIYVWKKYYSENGEMAIGAQAA